MVHGRIVETWRIPVVVKRAAALAAGLVVVAGLVGGCAQKPGVAATLTPVSCGKKADVPPVHRVASDGTVSWTCGDGPAVRGKSTTVSAAEVADVLTMAAGGGLSAADAIEGLAKMGTVLRVADEIGVTVSDADAEQWLDDYGYEKNDGTMVVAKYSILGTRANAGPDAADALTEEQLLAIDDGVTAALTSLDIVVNPRFGTFDPERITVVAPTWVPQSAFLSL